MTILEKFIAFASQLPSDHKLALETSLADIMANWLSEYDFSEDELSEIKQRLDNPSPQYADTKAIEKLLGKSFSA